MAMHSRVGSVGFRRVRASLTQRAAVGIFVALLIWVLATPTPAAAQNGRVVYQPPVAGPIVDDWRPPDNPYGAGNRGIDFFAVPGQPVFAAADGVVTFAGQVGGSLFVVMTHADGLRTTIGFVGSVTVRVGAVRSRGAKVAIAKGPVHFGVRSGNVYLDPRALFARRVWLVG
jgi:murein DD-endopeptidase MepM/ murein hydrolase activator NlpD